MSQPDKPRTPATEDATAGVLQRLWAVIETRRGTAPGQSYTAELLAGGTERCAKKLGEEATETIIAALSRDRAALTREAADLLYHLLVLLASERVPLAGVLGELAARLGTAGHAEKAARGKSEP
jgi:phosphoribosyl-ATP pyrophosphohydrolase